MKRNGGNVRVLQIGVGSLPVDPTAWPGAEIVRVDLDPETGADQVGDPRAVEDVGDGYDVVFTSHALQWVARTEVVKTLKHWAACLKPGGELHVIVPDLAWAADQIAADRSVDKLTLGVIFGTQHTEFAFHRTGFTADLLRAALYAAGLETRACRLGPYRIRSVGADGQARELVARQIYAVAVKPDGDAGRGEERRR